MSDRRMSLDGLFSPAISWKIITVIGYLQLATFFLENICRKQTREFYVLVLTEA